MKNPLACLLTLGMIALPSLAAKADATSQSKRADSARIIPIRAATLAQNDPNPKVTAEPNNDDDKIDLLAVIHDGEKLTFDEFRKRVGDGFAAKFKSIKPKSVERSGNDFILITEATTHSKYGLTVYISSAITFQATKHNRVLTAKNIEGVDVQVGPSTMKLREVVITPLPSGMVRIDGKLEISSQLPYIPVSITVDKNKVHQ